MKQPRAAVLRGVLSLVLALALWTFVSFTQNPTVERQYELPVATREPASAGLVVVDPQSGLPSSIDQMVDVLVAGPEDTLDDLGSASVEATVDLSELGAGTHTVPVDLRPQGGVRVRSRTPETLTVRLEPSAAAMFPVRPQVVSQPPFVQLDNDVINVATTEAEVSGTQAAVAQVANVRVRIDLQGRLQSYNETLPLEAVDQNNQPVPGVTVSPAETVVSVPIEPRVEPQQVSIVPQFQGQPSDQYVVQGFDWTPRTAEVIAPAVITSTLQTEPIVLTGRTESFTQTVQLVEPEGVVTRLPNNTVTVEVQIEEVAVRSNTSLLIPQVEVLNVGNNLRAEVPALRVTVSGTYQQFNELAGTTLQATVDAQGLGPGTHPLPVTIALPEGVRIEGSPPTADVTIVANPPPTATPAPTPAPSGG